MYSIEDLLTLNPYSLDKTKKHATLTHILSELTGLHYRNCPEYKKILDFYNNYKETYDSIANIPFLPVRMLKEYSLRSVPKESVVKTLTSSGTTGQQTAKVHLDAETAKLQQKILIKIVSNLIGGSRMPMIILDTSNILKNREALSARGAGILGFSLFASDKIYALDKDMNLNVDEILAFLNKHEGKPIFMFGFTYMVWLHFYKRLLESPVKVDLSRATLLHGGGWKKLANESVSSTIFKKSLEDVCGVQSVHDYYGMAEQTGTISIECSEGHLHTSNFSDVIIRNPKDFSVCKFGEEGLIETLSVIPKSYPGHALLTEDVGVIYGVDDCKCGQPGTYFSVLGRIKNAEMRGCSDTYAVSV